MTQPPQPHKALLTVTGWHTRRNGRDYLDGIWIGPPPAKMHGQRLTATLFPKTDTQGTLAGWLRWSSIYPAKRRPNDQQFEIVARLIRVDVASNQLSLQVFPAVSDTVPFRIQVRATTAVLRQVNSEWPAVRLTGSLIGALLVADSVEYAYAPIPERWSDWERGKSPDALARRKNRSTQSQECPEEPQVDSPERVS